MFFYLKNFGCKVNLVESEFIINTLLSNSFSIGETEFESDIVIINSCSVTKEAERQVFQYIRRVKRDYKDKVILLTGCMVDSRLEDIRNSELIDIAVSNFYKEDIPKILINLDISSIREQLIYYRDISEKEKFAQVDYFEKGIFHTRKFIKIQDGCDNFCSYCIIPLLRGKPKSLEMRHILKQFDYIPDKFREVVITGINIGSYGKDIGKSGLLLRLLLEIEELLLKNGVRDFRIRLSSLKPDEITEEFINFLKVSCYIAPHFHLSIQNFNDKVLASMNRHYNFERIKFITEKIRELIPYAGLGADIITAFPSEGSEEFEDNCSKMESSSINFFHIFPFSPREGTSAYHFKDILDKRSKRERVRILKKIADAKREKFARENLGRELKVLVEKDGDLCEGYSENYIRVFFQKEQLLYLKNKIVNVKGIEIKNKHYISGRLK